MVKSVYNFIHVTLSSLKRNTGFKEFHGNLSQKKVGEKLLKEYLEYIGIPSQLSTLSFSVSFWKILPYTHTHLTEGHRQRVRVENIEGGGGKNLKVQQFIKEIISLNWNLQRGGSSV